MPLGLASALMQTATASGSHATPNLMHTNSQGAGTANFSNITITPFMIPTPA